MLLINAWIIAFGCFLLISLSFLGYGGFFTKLIGPTPSAFALGVGTFCSLSLLTGIAGGYNIYVQSALVLVGCFLFVLTFRDIKASINLPQGLDSVWLIFPILYFLTRFFAAGLPQQHSDALYYHLLAPKFWAELGRIQLTPEHPSFGLAGIWESVYGISQMWNGTQGVRSHVICQIAGQWLHMFWGQFGSMILGAALLKKLIAQTQETGRDMLGVRLFLGWLCTSLPGLEWLGGLAKNDYILIGFVLAGVLEVTRSRFLVAGILIGFAYSTKVLAAWAGICLLLLIPAISWPYYVLGGLVGVFPFLLRNYLWTKNIFFPTLDNSIGPHWVSLGWIEHNLSYGGKPAIDLQLLPWMGNQVFHKALPKVLCEIGAVALLIEWVQTKHRWSPIPKSKWIGFLFALLGFTLIMLRPLSDGRYANYVAVLWVLFLAAAVVRAFTFRPGALFLLIPLGLLINTPVEQLAKIPRDFWFQPTEKYVESFHLGYDAQKWVHENVKSNESILFMAEKQHFYLDRPFEAVVEMKKWEDLLIPIKSAQELFTTLKAMGFRYVHFSPQAGGYPVAIRPYWKEIESLADKAVFKSPNSLIFDLSTL